MAETPHFDFPFRRGPDGKVATVEQDEERHQVANAEVVVRCPTNFRDDRPEFGWPFPEFPSIPIDLGVLAEALRRFGHPMAEYDVSEYAESARSAVRHILVEVETSS